jgi:lipid A 4'-phosphatase
MKKNFYWLLPLLFFLIYLPFSSSFDISVSSLFAEPGKGFHAPSWTWKAYRLALLPAQILFFASLFLLILSFFQKKKLSYRPYLWYFCLTLIIGSGLFVHALGKACISRPRPKQITEFQGRFTYKPLFHIHEKVAGKNLRSFPSGHATMGFYFLALFFLGKRIHNKKLEYLGLFLTILLGGVLSYIRLAQGGHFLSDIIVSFLIMWYTAYFLDRYMLVKLLKTKSFEGKT